MTINPKAQEAVPVGYTSQGNLDGLRKSPREAWSMWGEKNGLISIPLYLASTSAGVTEEQTPRVTEAMVDALKLAIDITAKGTQFLEDVDALCDWLNGSDISADHAAQKPDDFKRLCSSMAAFRASLSTPVSQKEAVPVAWQWRGRARPDLPWSEWREGRLRNTPKDPAHGFDFEERPLFLAPPAGTAPVGVVGGILAIAAERRRQVETEGWTPEHDDKHNKGEMAGAAACYAMYDLSIPNIRLGHSVVLTIRDLWPWALSWWKPTDARCNLVKAGALIAAEIDRLDRATPSTGAQDSASQAEA